MLLITFICLLDFFDNPDLTSIKTPIIIDKYKALLYESKYDRDKAEELINGFTEGFDIGYRGPEIRKDESQNIPLTVGNPVILWNKIMKEVKLGRVAGPFNTIPFSNYIQSPVGLVPKSDNQTRLIFHLSFDFGEEDAKRSLNFHTPKEWCTVKYKDLDYAIEKCLELQKTEDFRGIIFYSKTDLKSAFRILPLRISQFCWLCFKARNPVTGQVQFFADKCLPFGASISCSLFQKFSDSLKHLSEFISGRYMTTNYLDDFLFIGTSECESNRLVRNFLSLCEFINCPVSLEKTEWAAKHMVFLGILLDGENLCLAIPQEKVLKARGKIYDIITKQKKRATIKELQSLTGFLNFLNKAIVPGRAFTRRMYAKIPAIAYDKKLALHDGSCKLKLYHHVKLDEEFLLDCKVWLSFLNNCTRKELCRPFTDKNRETSSRDLHFYSDASGKIGLGCIFNKKSWLCAEWDKEFLDTCKPSIQYLELLALCVGIFAWDKELANMSLKIYCDNKAVRDMVNDYSSGCKNCMYLIRQLALNCLHFNRRIWVEYVKSEENVLADSLSRFDFKRFWENVPNSMETTPTEIPTQLWPVSKIWIE